MALEEIFTYRKEWVIRMAEAVRKRLNLATPIDLEAAVQKLGGEIKYFPSHEMEGGYEAIIRKIPRKEERKPSFVIELADDPILMRKRFSIAHELGHLFLHMGYGFPEKWEKAADKFEDLMYARNGAGRLEYEAHEFAAEILMPHEEFKEVWLAGKGQAEKHVDRILRATEHFQVSRKAAFNRARWLGLPDC